MSSILTVWTSQITEQLQSRVINIIGGIAEGNSSYDNISIAGNDIVEIKEKISNEFNRLVKLTNPDPTLHIVAIVPTFEIDFKEQIMNLYEACSSLEHSVTLHFLSIAPDISRVFETTVAQTSLHSITDLFKTICEEASFSISFSIIDDYAENGAPIRFSIDSLARYIALIQLVLMRDYYKLLSPVLPAAHQSENISIGVSSLSFNRDATARQLLELGFTEALDNVGINENKVDAQKASSLSEAILDNIENFYSNLYDESIKPLYHEKNLKESDVVAESSPILDKGINNLKERILSLLDDTSLSLPEKEGMLALILGRDNKNIRGIQFHRDGKLLDDAYSHELNLYVDAFNKHCSESRILPIRGDYEALKLYFWNDSNKEFEECEENKRALNPIGEIKRLKQEIINITSFLREKQDELNVLQDSMQQREIAHRIHRPVGSLKNIEYKEQPLDDIYEPSNNLKIKDSIDLRKFFNPVKSQQDLGSCSSFAAVAMYEAMMKQAGIDTNDMSPAFLFYHSNICNGRIDGGSNFYEQFKILGERGVCHEELYAYEDALKSKPSEQAQEDAKNHRLIAAKQIPLFDEPNKTETLKRNHKILTSALSEGFPIGISLKLYDNFEKNGAFILHPEDETDAEEDGWHAMVIVGYSEENGFYIVRNSWGADFGENGYCYIPSAYIDDSEYLNFACIITQISDSSEIKAEIPTVIANFAATETEIRIAAIRNVISRQRVELQNNQNLYNEYYRYYQRLVLQLTIPNVQNQIREKVEQAERSHLVDIEKAKRELSDSFASKIKDHKNRLKRIILFLSIITIGFGIGFFLSKASWCFLTFVILAFLLIITLSGYKWWKRIKRRNLQEEIDELYVAADKKAKELKEIQIRFHLAGMWIGRFHKLYDEIDNVYIRLESFNDSLHDWRNDYSKQISAAKHIDGQMFIELDASPHLQNFFNQNKVKILNNIDFIKLFEKYQINPDKLNSYHENLRKTVYSEIASLMHDFNIIDFLMGEPCEYLDSVNLPYEISTLINIGQLSFRIRGMNSTSSTHFILGKMQPDMETRWTTKINNLFPSRPIVLSLDDPNILLLITLHPQ